MRYGRQRNWWLRGPKPRFTEGDTAGDFTIVRYEGYSRVNPTTAVTLKCEHHWYFCRCKCGTEEYHTQQQLIDERRSRRCSNCARSRNEDSSEPN